VPQAAGFIFSFFRSFSKLVPHCDVDQGDAGQAGRAGASPGRSAAAPTCPGLQWIPGNIELISAVDPDPDSISAGCSLLRAEGFSCTLDKSKLQFLIISVFFPSVFVIKSLVNCPKGRLVLNPVVFTVKLVSLNIHNFKSG
jgi:hypothetical protein